MLHELKKGTKVNYMSRDFFVSDVVPPMIYMTRVGDGILVDKPLTEILENAHIFGESVPERNQNDLTPNIYDILYEKFKEDIERGKKIISSVLDFREVKANEQKREDFIQRYPALFPASTDSSSLTQEKVIVAAARYYEIDRRTVKRYLYDFLERGILAFIPKDALNIALGLAVRKDNKQLIIRNPYKHAEVLQTIDVRLSDEKYIEIIATSIEQDFLRDRIDVAAAIRRIEARCTKQNVVWPDNKSTLYKIFAKIDERHIARFRETKSEQSRFIEVHNGHSNEVALFPGQIVQIDHKLTDVILCNDDGEVVGRAWLTIAIDLYTRMVWGFHLSYNEPSIDKVLATLLNGTFLKRAKELYGTKNDWPIYGKVKAFHFDNGKDFRSEDIERVVTQTYGAELDFRPIRIPRYGGAIERFMKTLDTNIFHNVAGTTKSRPSQLRGNPADSAALTVEKATSILAKWIVDVYHYDDHDGLPPATPRPIDMYNEGIRIFGPPAYVDPVDEPRFKLNMMRQVRREYMKYGIRFDSIDYKAPELSDMIGSRKKLIVKYDNSDISKVYVLHPVTKEYVVATGTAVKERGLNLNGMSRYLYHWVKDRDKKHAEALKKSNPGAQSLQAARAELDTMLYGKKATRIDRKRAEKAKLDSKILPQRSQDTKMEALYEQLREQDI